MVEQQGEWEPYQDYGHNHWNNSLIWGENIHDCGIFGPSLIYGKSLSRGHDEKTLPNTTAPGVASKAITLKNCFGILATGVDTYPEPTMFGALPATGLFVRHAKNVEVSNLEIATVQPDARPPFLSMTSREPISSA